MCLCAKRKKDMMYILHMFVNLFLRTGAAAAYPRSGHGGAVAARRGRERVPRLPHAPVQQQEEGSRHKS